MLLNSKGSVSSDDILKFYKPETPSPGGSAYFSDPVSKLYTQKYSSYTSYISDLLNHCQAVHDHAVSLLISSGWSQSSKTRWVRPGKSLSEGISAIYNLSEEKGIYLFYNFSSSAAQFEANKAYTDVKLISILEYDSFYMKCLFDLIIKFKEFI